MVDRIIESAALS